MTTTAPGAATTATVNALLFPKRADRAAKKAAAAAKPTNSRDEFVATVKRALRTRSDRSWSVRTGRGTTWGWVTIIAPPSRCDEFGSMTADDRAALAALLGFDDPVGHQGVDVPPSAAYRAEYTERAKGLTVTKIAEPYWD